MSREPRGSNLWVRRRRPPDVVGRVLEAVPVSPAKGRVHRERYWWGIVVAFSRMETPRLYWMIMPGSFALTKKDAWVTQDMTISGMKWKKRNGWLRAIRVTVVWEEPPAKRKRGGGR